MKQLIGLFILGLIFSGCSSGKRDNCEKNQTGEVEFTNNSKTNKTYDIIWDGIMIATIEPGKTSKKFTYAANVPHSLVFKFTNSSSYACDESAPILTQCQENYFSCNN